MEIDVQPFLVALHDEDAHIRARSAEILGKLDDTSAIPALVAAMFAEENQKKFDRGLFFQRNVQDVAVEALLEIGGPAVVTVLESLLTHERHEWRTRGIALLRQLSMRDAELRPDIIRILQQQLQDTDLDMRTRAMEALRAVIIEDGQRT